MAEPEPGAREAPADADPAGLKTIAADTAQVQSSARWLIGALAAIGALLVPGLGLTKLGSLEGTRLAIAIAALVIALLAVLATIYVLMRFVRSGHLSLADLAARERKDADDDLIAYLTGNDALFRGRAKSLAELEDHYVKAHRKLAEAQQRAAARLPTKRDLKAAEARARLEALDAVEATVMDAARLAGHPDLTLADLANAQRARASDERYVAKPGVREALDYLAKHPALLGGAAETLDGLRNELLDARTRILELETADPEERAADEGESVEQAEARLGDLKDIVQQVEPIAGREDLRQTFKRWRLGVALLPLLIALAMATFVAAANAPPAERNDLSGQTIRDADLTGTKLEHADMRDSTFIDSDMTGADLDNAELDGTKFIRTRCPDGHLTAGAATSCDGHLKLRRPPVIKPTTGRLGRGDWNGGS